ncbi:MAG: tRNA (N6-threonylcarbamoyladenosine(37)-N6)-methyltransferase TrmO [Bacteroidales bacterium]|nr:tRNA (N6-threonylcarbamoyladenosine(37)-N6)-methyltransferase TrmO [Bacteroidales bacterium]
MEIKPVADYHGPLTTKFGIPRQSGLIDLPGEIVFRPAFRSPDAVRGLEGFDRIWLIWEFSDNPDAKTFQATVRPPRLGGNTALGVFATRSPFRPNRLGLSCVELVRIDPDGPVLHVKGADLMDGTPIYDIKPYVPYADAFPEARGGFTDTAAWEPLQVDFSPAALEVLAAQPDPDVLRTRLEQVLAQDPRPRFHHDPDRLYGMPFGPFDIRFQVKGKVLSVVEIVQR